MPAFSAEPKPKEQITTVHSAKPGRSFAGQSHTSKKSGLENFESQTGRYTSHHFAHSFSWIPLFHTPSVFIQPKLKISAPGDKYEQEADRVAEQVMRMPAPVVQRKCAQCEKEEEEQKIQLKPLASQISPLIQRQESAPAMALDSPPIVNNLLQSSGQALDGGTRSFMEERFGYDFSQVRVHADARAAASARAVQAQAYAVGRHIVFGSEQYRPNTETGRHLLAHELTHVVQQKGGDQSTVLQRAETDTSQNCDSLTDSKSDVNSRFNQALDKARANAGTPLAANKVIDEFFKELGSNTSLGRTEVENWAANLGPQKVNMPPRSATKFKRVNYMLWAQPSFPILNPTMKIKEICIGSDKLGHFVQQGFQYFDIAHRQSTGSVAEAEKFGEETESGGFGLNTTGVFSNADLEANRSGLKFYKDLESNPGLTFDIANYINDRWNEEVNPSFYETSVAQQVWSNLLSRTWTGTFTVWRGDRIDRTDVTVKLDASPTGSVKGSYNFTTSDGKKVDGFIRNGKIQFRTKEVQSKGMFGKTTKTPVSGVIIKFEWSEGAAGGRGEWYSIFESDLYGTWGHGSREEGRGTWNLKQ